MTGLGPHTPLDRWARRPDGRGRRGSVAPSDRNIRTVDRRLASRGLRSGLAAAAIALGVFGLTFFAAILYIG
jgi:hypothetical protein